MGEYSDCRAQALQAPAATQCVSTKALYLEFGNDYAAALDA
jgi:hypothetical protein